MKVKSETSPLLQIHIHRQMCNLAPIRNQYAPPMSNRTLLHIDMHHLPRLEAGAFNM